MLHACPVRLVSPVAVTFRVSTTSYTGLPEDAKNRAVAIQNDTAIMTRKNVTRGKKRVEIICPTALQ